MGIIVETLGNVELAILWATCAPVRVQVTEDTMSGHRFKMMGPLMKWGERGKNLMLSMEQLVVILVH